MTLLKLNADVIVDADHIGAGAVTTDKLGADAVDGTKIADDAVDSEHIAAGAIDTEHIGDGQVTEDKIAAGAVSEDQIGDEEVTVAKLSFDARPQVIKEFSVDLADIAGAGDVLTEWTPGFHFKIVSFGCQIEKAVSTPAKAANFALEIGTDNVTGGLIELAGTYSLGAVIPGSAITDANTGSDSDNISIEASSVTAFSEGRARFTIVLEQTDPAA